MYTVNELTDILSIRLSKKRFTHSINVAYEARKLAEHYGYHDPDKAYLAGLIHDCCKEIPAEEQLAMVKKSKRNVSEAELASPPLYHAIAGAYYAETVFGYTEDSFLDAIRYHTTARANMTLIEEIIYLADLVSADRSYKDAAKMRKFAYQSINKAMFEAMKSAITEVIEKESLIPPNTIEAYNYYALKQEKED